MDLFNFGLVLVYKKPVVSVWFRLKPWFGLGLGLHCDMPDYRSSQMKLNTNGTMSCWHAMLSVNE